MASESPQYHDQTQIGRTSGSDDFGEFTYIPAEGAPASFKQERDLAFALAALEQGTLTRKQIAQAVKDWTIHGDLTLGEHLQQKGLFSEHIRQKIEESAGAKLQKILEHLDSNNTESSSLRESILHYLDEYGRVASVLGLSTNEAGQTEFQRRVSEAGYQLLRKIGQGGLGVVWLARDIKLKRIVAIKEILRQSSTNSPEVRRFQREAEITGRLEHPSIVPLYQFGLDEETDQPFYVMRYIGKKTLEQAIDEFHERRSEGEDLCLLMHNLLNAFVSVCQAIAYAHSRNIIHRDLKPENVALDSYGQVIVLDWGLAKLTGEFEIIESCELGLSGNNSGIEQTQDGQVLGTPMYMAPEQASGRIDEIDERTDVYGLGAVLYAILTGAAPHEKTQESMTSTSQVSELLRKICQRTTDPRSKPESGRSPRTRSDRVQSPLSQTVRPLPISSRTRRRCSKLPGGRIGQSLQRTVEKTGRSLDRQPQTPLPIGGSVIDNHSGRFNFLWRRHQQRDYRRARTSV